MHASSLGIGGIDISTQAYATAAVDKIKAAINMVSDVRGTLGATQNRLDHTINNLSAMTENIQGAESTIRDTDVAAKMTAYTKNNILIQSPRPCWLRQIRFPRASCSSSSKSRRCSKNRITPKGADLNGPPLFQILKPPPQKTTAPPSSNSDLTKAQKCLILRAVKAVATAVGPF